MPSAVKTVAVTSAPVALSNIVKLANDVLKTALVVSPVPLVIVLILL